jgi:hypothetical protein
MVLLFAKRHQRSTAVHLPACLDVFESGKPLTVQSGMERGR